MARLAPSIIAADFTTLGAQLTAVEPYSSRWHVDVMDGHYVPNLTIGPMVLKAIADASDLPQDAHLMVSNPDETWEWYRGAGAQRIAFHPEVSADPGLLCKRIADAGLGPGIAINPDVAIADVEGCLAGVDHVVIMSVYPGFSGQAFIPDVLVKATELRRRVDAGDLALEIIIDGGVSLDTAPSCIEAGVDTLVSASAIFGAPDPAAVARSLSEV